MKPTCIPCPLGFAGPDPIGAPIQRIYLVPGETFPEPVDGILHAVTYRGEADHWRRALEAKAYGAPLLMGFHHEPEDDVDGETFVEEYIEFVTGLETYHVRNVRTWWVLMAWSFGSGKAESYWPGDDFVDVVGADGYDWSGCRVDQGGDGYSKPKAAHRSFAKVFAPVETFAAAHSKPIVVGEFGTPDDHAASTRKVAWLQAAGEHLKATPAYEGACYFQHSVGDGFRCNWTLAGYALEEYRDLLADPYFGGSA